MSREDKQYMGIHPDAPKQPNLEAPVKEGDNSRHLTALGHGALANDGYKPYNDAYLKNKRKDGLIDQE